MRMRISLDGGIIDGVLNFYDEHGNSVNGTEDANLWARLLENNPNGLVVLCGKTEMIVDTETGDIDLEDWE